MKCVEGCTDRGQLRVSGKSKIGPDYEPISSEFGFLRLSLTLGRVRNNKQLIASV